MPMMITTRRRTVLSRSSSSSSGGDDLEAEDHHPPPIDAAVVETTTDPPPPLERHNNHTPHHHLRVRFGILTDTFSVGTLLAAIGRHIANDDYRDPYPPHLEPVWSTVHLLAHVLQLPWKTGYLDLLPLLMLEEDQQQGVDAHVVETCSSSISSSSSSSSSLANRIVTVPEFQLFCDYWQRRFVRQEPLQYMIGQWEFDGHIYQIVPPLLCPRPETEELVHYARRDLARMTTTAVSNTKDRVTHRRRRLLDIGSGTGCIGISFLLEATPEWSVTAIDVEPVAIRTSRENAQRLLSQSQDLYEAHCIGIEPFARDLQQQPQPQPQQQPQPQESSATDDDTYGLFDLVVSNPPYILPRDMATLDPTVLWHESHVALNGGGDDGLNVIRSILAALPTICRTNAICWLEVDPSQPPLIEAYCQQQQSCSDSHKVVRFVECVKDMFGKDRFVKLQVVAARSML